MWPVRRSFWNWLLVRKFKFNKPEHIPVPTDDGRKLATIPLVQRYPSIPIADIRVGDHVPDDEDKRFNIGFCEFQMILSRVFSQEQPNLPPISGDMTAALDQAYPAKRATTFPAPQRPQEYLAPIDLGALAVAGPYACFLEKAPEADGDGEYQWDLLHLNPYEVHDGLHRLGVRVRFAVDAPSRRVVATRIDSDLGTHRPGDPGWDQAVQLSLCAATNFFSLIRHFGNVHLTAVAQLAVATRNSLPGAHPVRRVLWPHVWGTEYSNELVTNVLLGKGGDFEGVFSFTHAGLCALFCDWYPRYDIRTIDPEVDALRRGIVDGGFDLPARANRVAHLEVMRAHTRRYLGVYYHSDEDLRADGAVMAWIDDLEQRIPGGVTGLLGDEVTVVGLARLLAAFVYLGSVEHSVLGTGLWNYQVWADVQPVRVYRNGQRLPVDVFQRLVNYNFVLNVRRAPLVQDFSYLGLDPEGAACFRTFFRELQDLQTRLEQEEFTYWKMYPNILDASVNG